MLVYGKGDYTSEHEKKMFMLKEMVKNKLKHSKIGFCVIKFPKKLDEKWEIYGSVIINGKDFDFEAVFQKNKMKIKKNLFIDHTNEILKKIGRSQKFIDNLKMRYIDYLRKEGFPEQYIDNIARY